MAQALVQSVAVERIHPSKTNPRHEVKDAGFDDLVSSVREHGILQPILVRPNAKGFEIVAGHRRFAAATAAGLDEIPAMVREMDDQVALEIQVIENLQRSDLTVLEEAKGYELLMTKHGYSAERIAERIGKSVKYVYDRVKLGNLTATVKTLLAEGRLTAGHAILLARLSAKDQERVVDPIIGGCFEGEQTLWDPVESPTAGRHRNRMLEHGKWDGVKVVTVRELEGWIAEHVRHTPAAVDPFLFPEVQAAIEQATQKQERLIHITHDHFIPPVARDPKTRTWGPRSWKRADGAEKSKTCEYSITGFVAVGPDAGQAFKVCVQREKCKVHWATEQKEKAARAKSPGAKSKGSAQDRWKLEDEKRKKEQAIENAARARYAKAKPRILDELAAAVKRASAAPGKLLGSVLTEHICQAAGYGAKGSAAAAKRVPLGKTAEDLVRHLTMIALLNESDSDWDGSRKRFTARAKAFGVDVAKLIDEEAPAVQTSAAPAKKGRKKK
ncbi:MAG: hypothetical protein RI885_2297 [Actinomycetota bacterium]|jgi:ParB/RepB/Spo0J family partition protein